MDTKGPIFPSSDGNLYIYLIVHAFTNYVVLHPSPRHYAADALNVFFHHWIVEFGIPDIIVTDIGNETMNVKFALFCRMYKINNLNQVNRVHHGQMD